MARSKRNAKTQIENESLEPESKQKVIEEYEEKGIYIEEDKQVDALNLEESWLTHSDLVQRYGEHEADTEETVDRLKDQLEAATAAVELELRRNWDDEDVKQTEAAIKARIATDDRVIDLQKQYREAKYRKRMASAYLKAIEVKKAIMENIVRMKTSELWADPRVGTAQEGREFDETAKRNRANENAKRGHHKRRSR